jgi:hypothetical protein
MPGDCSPSRNVVSKTVILRTKCSFVGVLRTHYFRLTVGVCGVEGRVGAHLPLEGENEDDRNNEHEHEPEGGLHRARAERSGHLQLSVQTPLALVKLHI